MCVRLYQPCSSGRSQLKGSFLRALNAHSDEKKWTIVPDLVFACVYHNGCLALAFQ